MLLISYVYFLSILCINKQNQMLFLHLPFLYRQYSVYIINDPLAHVFLFNNWTPIWKYIILRKLLENSPENGQKGTKSAIFEVEAVAPSH